MKTLAIIMNLFGILCIIVALERINTTLVSTDFKSVQNNTLIDYQHPKVLEMRITGYVNPKKRKTALMEDTKAGYTAAVSPDFIHLLGERVYIKGYGVRYVNDLTHPRIDEMFEHGTIDLCVNSEEEAMFVGNSVTTVVRIGNGK